MGRGDAASALECYAQANRLDNVEFSGFYEKMDEAMIAIFRAEAEFPNVTTFSELYETSKSKTTQNQQRACPT